jgi:hypothetical protein
MVLDWSVFFVRVFDYFGLIFDHSVKAEPVVSQLGTL